jgi:pilus assembly protein CpaB
MATLVLARRRRSAWSMLALVAAAATGISVFSYVSWLRAQVPSSGGLVPTVVAVRDIDSGVVLTPAMVTLQRQPRAYLPDSALYRVDAVVGHVTAIPILRGEAVTARKIGSTSGASSVVPAGMRAYSLSAQSGVSMAMVPKAGDRVDVMATFPDTVAGVPTTLTILRSAKVASVNGNTGGSSGRVGSRLGITGSGQGNWSITLLVTPEQAQGLAMSESLGKIAVVVAPVAVAEEPVPQPITPPGLDPGR